MYKKHLHVYSLNTGYIWLVGGKIKGKWRNINKGLQKWEMGLFMGLLEILGMLVDLAGDQFKFDQFKFVHLNLTITRPFFLIRWQACSSSGSTNILVDDSVWHTDYSKTSSTISGGTGLISIVSLLLYGALFRLLRSNWVIHLTRSSLQRLEIDRLEFSISYLASKSLKRSISPENFELMSFLKSSRLKTSSMSSSSDKFPIDFLFLPLLLIINRKRRYELGKNGDGCKKMLTLRRS